MVQHLPAAGGCLHYVVLIYHYGFAGTAGCSSKVQSHDTLDVQCHVGDVNRANVLWPDILVASCRDHNAPKSKSILKSTKPHQQSIATQSISCLGMHHNGLAMA